MAINPDRVLRPATVADATEIARIHVSSWQAGYAGIVPDEYLRGLSIERHTDVWRERIECGTSDLWLLEERGSVCGWVASGIPRSTGMDPHSAEIYAIYVAPACWSRGIGRVLLGSALDRLVAQHYASCFLWVLVANARARRFYEQAGFLADRPSLKRISIGAAALDEIRYTHSFAAGPVPGPRTAPAL